MAKFQGIYPAPKLTPAPCGLLSVADVWRHTRAGYDERWVRGFAQEFEAHPSSQLLSQHGTAVPNGELSDESDSPEFTDIVPFYIEVSNENSAMDYLGDGREARVLRQLEAISQKAVERELWEGVVALADASDNRFLVMADGAETVSTAGVSPIRALALLEQSIANSPTGANGVIHMTRDVATLLLGGSVSYADGHEGDDKYLETILGTPISVGSGYTGNGPAGSAASDTNKWMFATGAVVVHLGKPELLHDRPAQGFNPKVNNMAILASRPAAVVFDPSIFSAAQVTLS